MRGSAGYAFNHHFDLKTSRDSLLPVAVGRRPVAVDGIIFAAHFEAAPTTTAFTNRVREATALRELVALCFHFELSCVLTRAFKILAVWPFPFILELIKWNNVEFETSGDVTSWNTALAFTKAGYSAKAFRCISTAWFVHFTISSTMVLTATCCCTFRKIG